MRSGDKNMLRFGIHASQVKFVPRTMPLASLPSGLLGSPCRLIPYLRCVKWLIVFKSDALYGLVSLKYCLINPPALTTVAYKNIACSSGQPWMEKNMICPLIVCLCPSPGPNSILDRLPDLSSLQWRGDPFCSRRWPGSVCVDHHYELLRSPDAIQALRPPATSH